MKQLKDYLHLYLGCDAIVNSNPLEVLKTDAVWLHSMDGYIVNLQIRDGITTWYEIRAVKPILRPLSDMTEEEKIEMGYPNTSFAYVFGGVPEAMVLKPHEFLYLLSKRFDLFGLIEAGLAIDKNAITTDL